MMKPTVLLFLLALVIRLAAIFWWQFDGLYGQDPFAYFQQAEAIVDRVPQGQPPPTDFFWPNGYPALIAVFMLLLGKTALAGQVATLLSGAALAPLAYWLCRDLGLTAPPRHWGGIVAGLIIAVAGQPILSSVVVMADMPALFWATLAAWAVVRATRVTPTDQKNNLVPVLWFLAAGAALALAIVTRWVYVLITPALVGYTLYQLWRGAVALWPPLGAALSGAIILSPQLWLTWQKSGGLRHSWLQGWQPINFISRQFENIDGHFSYLLPVGVFYAQPAGHPAYIFPLLGLAAGWAVWSLWRAGQWGPLILLLGWVTPVYLFLGGIPYQNFRFGLTLYLPLVVLTGAGLNDLLGRMKMESIASSEMPNQGLASYLQGKYGLLSSPMVLAALVGLSLLGMLAWAYPMVGNFLTSQNDSKAIARQIERQLPAESTLVTFGLTLTFQHYTQLNTFELFYFDEAALNELAKTEPSFYLLLDPISMERQWAGKAPAQNFQWFRHQTSLTQLAEFPPYVLFKVEP